MSQAVSSAARVAVPTVDSLEEAARQAVGFGDFGDPAYREGLRVLLDAYAQASELNARGRAWWVETHLLEVLKNRLVAQRAWIEHPAILRTEIRRPIFIVGLVRTGTTALHNLLGQDPNMQVLEHWMGLYPSPRPPVAEWDEDPRFRRTRDLLERMYRKAPRLKAVHLMTAGGPDECGALMEQNFTSDTFDCSAALPAYSEWYDRQEMLASYARHRDLLKLIGSTSPQRRWVLKYPTHVGYLRALFGVYPDACIVHTHRDPAKVIPSVCSLVGGTYALYQEHVDRRALGAFLLARWAARVDRALEVRRTHDPRQFFDLHLREIVSDPVGAAKRIYRHFDIELSPEAERRFTQWQMENPRGKHGEHQYAAEEFGLSEDLIAERFARYMQQFGIARERSRSVA
ncbi:MAG: sulfotransferase [Candidatus Binatia bacterium]